MKQKFLYLILLCSAMMFGQNSTFNNASGAGDGKWSTATNWSTGVLPTGTATIGANVDLDVNVSLSGGVTSGASIVTTSNNSKITIPTTTATISTGLLCNGANFNFNAPIEFNSSGNTTFLKSLQVNNVSGGTQRILTLGASSVLTLNSLMRVVTQFDSKVIFRGKIEGSSSLQLTGISEFATTADNTNFNGDFVYINANSGTVVSNTTVDGGFLKAGRKVQVNATGNNLTINGANSCDGNVVVGGTHAFTLNINADQGTFGTISVAEGSLAINVGAAVTNLSFADCSAVVWGTAGTVAFTGFQPGKIRFGTSSTALTTAQLLKITADGAAAGKSLILDANGYLAVDDLIVFNNALGAGDGKWSTATNWDSGSLPVVSAQLNADVNLDIDTTLSSFLRTSTNTLTGTGKITFAGGASDGIALLSTGANFTYNGKVELNSPTATVKALQVNNSVGGSNRQLTLGSSSVLTLNTIGRVVTQQPSISKVVFAGKIEGTANLQITGTTEFDASSDNSTYDGDFVFTGANTSVIANTTGVGYFLKTGRKVQVNVNNCSLTINGANSNNGNISVDGANAFALNINANQEAFGSVKVGNSPLTLNVAPAVTNLSFAATAGFPWGTGSLVITGYQAGEIRFGTSSTALTPQQLSQITADGAATGQALGLDINGYLVLASSIVTPVITQFSSNGTDTISQACEGSTLVLVGTGFTGATSVTVNDVPLTGVTVVSDSRIDAVLPIGATSGAVKIFGLTAIGSSTENFSVTANSTNTTTVSSVLTYTWANNGQTYTSSGVYTGLTTNCVTELLDLTITTTAIPTTFPAFCKGATVATATGSTTMKFYAAATGGLPLAGTIALSNAKTYFVSEVINSVETARVSRFITVNNLPSTPSLLVSSPLDESKLICKYIGSSTPVTFNVTATGAVSYIWTVPAGASIVSGDTTSSVGVSFAGASTTPGVIGAVTVKSVDTNGCASLAKSLTLSTKLPTAPASLVMTSADSTPHFDVITTPAVIGVSPAIYSTVGLNYLTKITKVGPYIGTNTVFTLTAPTSTTAASYAWTLPSGATQLSGGSSNVITVDFAGVPSGIGSLPIVVKSVGGCGLSSARTLTLGRTVPGAPKALVLTNTSQSNLSGLTKITKVGPYTGTNISFTLTATPFRTQGATSTSYAWVLPAGVTCTTASTPTNVNVIIPPTVEGGLPTVNVVPAISTPTSTITVNFSTATGSGNLELSVFGVNGAGNSVARKLVLARALPSSPTKLVLTDDAISTTLAVTKVGPYTAKTTPLTLTATPFLTQGAEATSFVWTLPTGVNVTAGATLVSNNGATRTFSGTATVLTINLAGISGNSPSATSLPMSVSAVNGVGTSLVPRTLTVTAAAPTAPAIVGSTGTTYSSCVNTTYTATLFQGATYAWTIPAGASIVGVTNGNVIVVDYSGVSVPVNGSSAVTCIATNGVGSSPAKSLTVKRVAGTCRLSNSSASAFTAKAYPNPSSSEFTIETSAKGAMSVKVYDMQGRLVEKADTNKVGSKLAAGTYNVIVNQGANTKSVRVIKK